MPMYYFQCPDCAFNKRAIRKSADILAVDTCPDCKKPLVRDPRGASSRCVEVLDNGIMTRRVERHSDVERLNTERSVKPQDREP